MIINNITPTDNIKCENTKAITDKAPNTLRMV